MTAAIDQTCSEDIPTLFVSDPDGDMHAENGHKCGSTCYAVRSAHRITCVYECVEGTVRPSLSL